MDKEEIVWPDTDRKRDNLLSKSDWTQLPDTGLTVECVFAWREWRHKIRDVNHKNYTNHVQAAVALEKLRDAKPSLDFSGKKYTFFERTEGSVYSRFELKDMIKDILEELQPAETSLEEPVKELTLDDITNIKIAKRHVQREIEVSYRAQLKKVSPSLESTQLYVERLNQAIDFLAKTGSSFPLLEVLVNNSNKTMDEIASNLLKRHGSMISEFARIEDAYIKGLKAVNDSVTIDDLKRALDTFNGH